MSANHLRLDIEGAARGYRGSLAGAPGVQIRLLPSSEIAAATAAGRLHLAVVGEDLLREQGESVNRRVRFIHPLGIGRASLVVAAPRSWIDVDSLRDLRQVAAIHRRDTGRSLRVATKYPVQAAKFFAQCGLVDYAMVTSTGATEAAPANDEADFIVDITTTGATLRANKLKVLSDGIILESQFHLVAGLTADWSPETLRLAAWFVEAVVPPTAADCPTTMPLTSVRDLAATWREAVSAGAR